MLFKYCRLAGGLDGLTRNSGEVRNKSSWLQFQLSTSLKPTTKEKNRSCYCVNSPFKITSPTHLDLNREFTIVILYQQVVTFMCLSRPINLIAASSIAHSSNREPFLVVQGRKVMNKNNPQQINGALTLLSYYLSCRLPPLPPPSHYADLYG